MSEYEESPINPLPPVVVALVVVIAGIELLLSAGQRGFLGGPEAVGWRITAIEGYAFFDMVWEQMRERRYFPPEHMARFVTYPLIHSSFTHAIFALVFLLALGKMVGEIFRAWAVLVVFFASAIMGALVYGLLLDTQYPLIGAFPAVYGLIGAYTFLMWVNYSMLGENRYRAFLMISLLLGVQLLFGLLFGGGYDWVADLAGFATGFLLSFIVSPGGWARLMERMRNR